MPLDDGRRAFVKAAVTAFHRREPLVTEALSGTGLVPRPLGTYDDGAWVAPAFEEVPGRPPVQPWQPAELDRVLRAVLAPAPISYTLLAPRRLGGWGEVTGSMVLPDELERLRALEKPATRCAAWIPCVSTCS
jgi:hypothetical protein